MGTHLYVRVCNDDPCFAPAGHSVVQTVLATNYDWWASQGVGYAQAKERLAELALSQLVPHFPELRASLRMTDIATPITYQRHARSWRGACEGWVPNADSLLGHVSKTLRGLSGFYMAGQWVEPGGGVPLSITSGRQVVELICRDLTRPFTH
jgi:phytoene desaturase